MIIFESDWAKYPTAVLHLETKNEHFKKLVAVYKKMGVRNHAFPLALIQPELANIDPHDINSLSLELMSKILYECKHNFWYFIREVIKAPPLVGTEPELFKANRANIAVYWLYFNHVTSVLIQPRQTGKSFSIDVLMIYLLNIGTTNSLINMLTRSDDLRNQNLIRLKKIQEELPFYLNFRNKKDIFNTEEIKISGLSNMYKGNLSNASPKLANNVGRGFTSPTLHVDEGCFVPNIEIALSAALMAGNAARDAANVNNMPYGTIITTTTGKIDERDAKYIYKLVNNATVWDELFLDAKDISNLNEIIITNSRATGKETKRAIVNLTFSYRQLGYSDEWMRSKLQETIAEGDDADRDLFNKWTSGTLTSPIPLEQRDIMRASIVENYRTEIYKPYNYILRWYISENEIEYRKNNGVSFIIGVDTSDAVGKDDIAFVMRDHTTAEVLCVATFNELNLITLADFFVHFLMKYLNAVMIIERRSSAIAIIDYMIQKFVSLNINPFKRLWNIIAQNKDENKKEFETLLQAKYYNYDYFIQNKKSIGFATSGSGITSRSELYSTTLLQMCKYTNNIIYDKVITEQILGLIIKNNRVDHADGNNDDLVIASLLSYWLLSNGKNLEYYDIDVNSILNRNRNYITEKYSDTNMQEQEMLELEDILNTTLIKFKEEKDPYISMQLENKLVSLSREMSTVGNKVIAIGQMINDIKKNKKLKR